MKWVSLKLVTTAIFAFTSLNVVAQEPSFITKRQELVKKNQNTKPLVVAFYNSNNKNLDVNLMWNRLAPYSNYLSEQLNNLVIIDVDNSYYNLNKDVLSNTDILYSTPLLYNISVLDNTDILYSTPLLYSQLKDLGWRPIVRANQQIKPIIIVTNNSSIKDLNGLKGKKIMVEAGTTMSSYLKVELFDKKILPRTEAKDKFIELNSSTDALLNYLHNHEANAIAVSDNVARRLIAENKNKYRAISTDSSAPGLVVYISPKISEEQAQQIQKIFLDMKLHDETVRNVLSAAGELVASQVNQFVEVNDNELMKASQIFRQSKASGINLK